MVLICGGVMVWLALAVMDPATANAQNARLTAEQQEAIGTWIETRTESLNEAAAARLASQPPEVSESPAPATTPTGPGPAVAGLSSFANPALSTAAPAASNGQSAATTGRPAGAATPSGATSIATDDLTALVNILKDPARRQALIALLQAANGSQTDTPPNTGGSPLPDSAVAMAPGPGIGPGTGTSTGTSAGTNTANGSPVNEGPGAPTTVANGEAALDGTAASPEARTGSDTTSALPSIVAPDIAALTAYLRDRYDHIVWSSGITTQAPQLIDWITLQFNENMRGQWLRVLWQMGLVVLGGVVAALLARVLVSRPAQRLHDKAATTAGERRRILLLTRLVLKLIPTAMLGVAAQATAPLIEADLRTTLVAAAVITAVVLQRASMIVLRGLFAPRQASLRLLPLRDDLAIGLHRGLAWIVPTLIFGYLAVEIARLFGMPPGSRQLLGHLVGLLVMGIGVRTVFHLRAIGKRTIRGFSLGTSSATAWMTGLQRGIADIWHLLAAVYVVVIYAAWVVDPERWFSVAGWGTLNTLALVVGAVIVLGQIQKWRDAAILKLYSSKHFDRPMRERGRRYVGILAATARTALGLACLVLILDSWTVDAVTWVTQGLGGRAVSIISNLILVLFVAVVLWEGVNFAIERYLTTTDPEGKVIERGQRERTLLPLLRNVLTVFLVIVVALILLSELGLDIAPLLAGAGVVGLAIGFGSQKLVQDVITGIFNLLEDTIAVGDVIQVGGHSGVVEAMSIRSLRLRDLSGNLHTIPFSVVDTVTNMTKDFSYYLLEIGVAYRENTDDVVEIIKEVGADLQADDEYGAVILEPVEVLGVDAFQDSAVLLKARIKTKPIMQWWIGREYLRRLKLCFDERGVEIPFPHMTVYFGVDKEGNAPPAHLHVDRLAAMGAKMRPTATAPTTRPRPHPTDTPTDTTALLPDPDGDAPGADR